MLAYFSSIVTKVHRLFKSLLRPFSVASQYFYKDSCSRKQHVALGKFELTHDWQICYHNPGAGTTPWRSVSSFCFAFRQKNSHLFCLFLGLFCLFLFGCFGLLLLLFCFVLFLWITLTLFLLLSAADEKMGFSSRHHIPVTRVADQSVYPSNLFDPDLCPASARMSNVSIFNWFIRVIWIVLF